MYIYVFFKWIDYIANSPLARARLSLLAFSTKNVFTSMFFIIPQGFEAVKGLFLLFRIIISNTIEKQPIPALIVDTRRQIAVFIFPHRIYCPFYRFAIPVYAPLSVFVYQELPAVHQKRFHFRYFRLKIRFFFPRFFLVISAIMLVKLIIHFFYRVFHITIIGAKTRVIEYKIVDIVLLKAL